MAFSFTSGGRLAKRTRLVPIPAIAVLTVDSTPLWCLYSVCPFVSVCRACTYTLCINFMYTCLFVPSIWIMLTVCSGNRRTWWIHSWVSYSVVICGQVGSNYTLFYCDVRPLCTNTTLPLSLLNIRRPLDLTYYTAFHFLLEGYSLRAQPYRLEALNSLGIRSRTVQPVVSRYIVWATRPMASVSKTNLVARRSFFACLIFLARADTWWS